MKTIEIKNTFMDTEKEIIKIVDYRPEYRLRFKEINEEWITKSYFMEEEDIKTLNDPEEYILKNGGKIYMALHNQYPVGTCAYLNMGNQVFEMIKMAVDEKYRGLKIGKKIGEHSIESLRKKGVKKIILFSNTKGSATAIQLYYKLGFVKIDLDNSEFIRADIKMEINF